MSEKDVPNQDANDGTTDEVAAKLAEFGANDEVVAKVKELGADSVEDLAQLNETDLVAAGVKVVQARKLLNAVRPAVSAAADTASLGGAVIDAMLPGVQDDESWLKALKTGGVLKVDESTFIAAVRAALAKRVGLYDVPAKLTAAMEAFADESEEQVDPTFYALREQMTRRSYADIFAAVPGLNGSFVTEKRKNQLLSRLEQYLWPAVAAFDKQLKSWYDTYRESAKDDLLLSIVAGKAGALLPGVAPIDASPLRDSADAVKDAVNKVFAGTGVQIAAALAYEASEIKKSLTDPRLPALTGAVNREQMLKKLGVAVPATYPRLETNLTKYVLSVIKLEDQASGQEEVQYLAALWALGSQIDWTQLGGGRGNKYSTLGD